MSGRPWTDTEIEYLRDHYANGSAAAIATALGRSTAAVWQRAMADGLTTYRWRRGQPPAELLEFVREGNQAGKLDTWICREWNQQHPDQPVKREAVGYLRRKFLGAAVPAETVRAVKQAAYRKQCETLRVKGIHEVFQRHLHRESRRDGWPGAKPLERRILKVMQDGQYRTRAEIAAAINQQKRNQRWLFKCRYGSKSALCNLVQRGLLKRSQKQVRRGIGKGYSAYEYWMPLEVIRGVRRG